MTIRPQGPGACAHRGDNRHAPPNTVPAFRMAVEKGAAQVELDVKLTRDRHLVVRHDVTVDSTTDATGNIADLTLSQVKALDAGVRFSPAFEGVRIPTLDEALDVIPAEVLVNVHVHDDAETAVRTALRLDERQCLDHCFLTMGRKADFARAAARAAVPEIALCRGHLAEEDLTPQTTTIDDEVLHVWKSLAPGRVIDPQIQHVQLVGGTRDRIRAATQTLHGEGAVVNYCCASTSESIREVMSAGVDYILTDDLDLCLQMLNGEA